MGDTTQYRRDQDGKWWVTLPNQCPHVDWMDQRCQGAVGHKGVHWYYSPSGFFQHTDNDADPTQHGFSGSIPPEHPSYVHPAETRQWHHRHLEKEELVTDPVLIQRLDNCDITEDEWLTGHIDDDWVPDEETLERLKESVESTKDYKPGKPKVGG